MFRTFIVGLILGVVLAAAGAWLLPVADLHRERSLISVLTNGGTIETMQIQLPEDRLVATGSEASAFPAGIDWPVFDGDSGTAVELFKVRNRDNVVIGVASRIAAMRESGPVIEWAIHLPARGTMYFPLAAEPDVDGRRTGELRAGTREFRYRTGTLSERLVEEGPDSNARIELLSSLLSQPGGTGGVQ